MKFFVAVAEHQSITKAAKALNITQPAVTRGILQLEEELEVSLFDRLPRSMHLTRFGESYLRHVQAVFVQLDNARAELRHLADSPIDEIVIGAGPTWLMGVLPEVLGEFTRNNPNVTIRIRGGYDKQLSEMLYRGEVSFILSDTNNSQLMSNLVEIPLIHCEYVVACGKAHPLAGRKKVQLHELLEYPWAMPDQAERALARLTGIYLAQSLYAPEPLVRSTSLSFILRLLGTSDTLTFVVRSSLKQLQSGKIAVVDVDHVLPTRTAGIVKRKDEWESPVVANLVQQLRRYCEKNPNQ